MLQYSSRYDTSIHTDLKNANWDEILPRLFKYAVARAKMFEWIGYTINPEDLVNEAIASAFGVGERNSYRNWDKEKCPDLTNFLIGIIKSKTNHTFEHYKSFPVSSLYHENEDSKEEKALKINDGLEEHAVANTPEDDLIESENFKILKDKLSDIANSDEDLGMIILCAEDGIHEPRKIAEATGFEIKKVYNLLRKLRRRLDKHKPKRTG